MKAISEDAVLVLYGSAARGDHDQQSDTDVLVVSNSPSTVPARSIPHGASISCYDWSEWEQLRRDGSIFLCHLAAESRILWTQGDGHRRFRRDLVDLPPYRHALRDFEDFSTALADIRHEVDSEDGVLSFELATLAMIARHTSILVCYLLGEVNFSRLKSMRIAHEATNVASVLSRDFEALYAFRLADQRGAEPPTLPEASRARVWIDECIQLIRAGKELVKC